MPKLALIPRSAFLFMALLALGGIAATVAPAPVAAATGAPALTAAAAEAPAWRVLETSATGLRLELTIPELQLRAGLDAGSPDAVTPLIPGGVEAGAPGAPALPTISRLVAVPAGARVTGAVVDWSAATFDDLDLVPARADEAAPYGRAAEPYTRAGWQRPMFPKNTNLLNASVRAIAGDKAAAAPLAAVGSPAIMAGQTVVALAVAPVLYDATTRRLSACGRVVIDLRFDTAGAPATAARPLPRSFALLAAERVLNLPRDKTLPAAGAEPGRWVAVARNNATVLAKLQPLLDWRRRQGYTVEVVDADAAGNTTAGIKAALQALYDDPTKPPLEFVVLVGDAPGTATASSVPTWRETLTNYNGEGDHYYAMLDGDDILADVHIGRLSFSNSNLGQLDIIVNKILGYEKTPPMDDTSWYGRASLMGDPTSSGITCIWVNQWLKTKLETLGWSHIDTTWSGNFATQMTTTLNPGASVFAYRGYLNMSGITYGHIDLLTNGGRLPVALIPTCGTGSFATDNEARSEAWLRAPGGGGIASVGTATIGTHTRYNNAFFLNAWDGLLAGADHRVGAGQTAGKVGLYTNYYVGEPDKAEIWAVWNSLMGDPATDMWMGVPQPLTVTAPATLALGAGTFAVTVKSGFAPVPGLLVCALDAGGERLRGITDAQGQVTLSGKPPVAGALKLTVSGHGFLPYLGTITVGQQATFCGLIATQLVDDGTLGSSGNGDGQPSPGETVAVLPTLTNSGTEAAFGVGSTLTGGAPLAAVTNGSQAYGDIAAGQSVAALAPALVTLGAGAPDGQVIDLGLAVTSGAQTWPSTVSLTVRAPRYAVTATAFGGPGGSCDPGESGTLALTLANEGALDAADVVATLATTSPWLLVTQPAGAFGPVVAGGSADNAAQPFAVYASPECFAGHLAPCTLTLTSNGVMLSETTFTLQVGLLTSTSPSGPDAYGYYAFDDTDTASGRAPAYAWVELAPALGGSGLDVGLADSGWEQDDTKTVDLPFPFRYYGKDQGRLSICSNGWAAFGECALVSYHNAGLPGAGGTPPALLAPFWDNLYQSGANKVYHWHDTTQHRYVVEWHQMPNDFSDAVQEFELILLDPAYHQTTSGEGMILFQYKTVNNTDSRDAYATVGIQGPDGRDGLLYAYWNHTMGGAAPLATGRAILFMPLGELVQAQALVSPSSVVAGAAPGTQVTREVTIANTGDAGSVLRASVAKVDPATVGGKSLTGSTLTADAVDYEAGTTVTLNLTINCVSQGQEWIREVTFDAPPGVTVVSSTAWTGPHGSIPSNNATGDGASVFWSGGGYLDNGNTGLATVTVTFAPTLAGPAAFDWILQGDNWGDPPHTITGQVVLASRGPSITVSAPVAGTIATLGQPLTVQFAALNGPTQVSVELQREEGGAWETLVASTPAAAGSWTWSAVTGAPGPYARLRVRDVAEPLTEGQSGVFAIGRDLAWLQLSATTLEVPAGAEATLTLTLDATGLAAGAYEALVVIAGNGGPPALVPVTFNVSTASAVGGQPLPAAVTLLGAVPNPFNPRTVIRFAVPAAQDARLEVYSVDGRLVRRLLDGRVTAGAHDVAWDGRDDAGRDASSGVYFHRLTSGGEVRTGKMILAR